MKIVFRKKFNLAKVTREKNEKRYSTESAVWYALKKTLITKGFDVIKKCPDKDGQMTSAPYYVRTRSRFGPASFLLHDGNYAVRNLAEDFNKNGKVVLLYLTHLDKE